MTPHDEARAIDAYLRERCDCHTGACIFKAQPGGARLQSPWCGCLRGWRGAVACAVAWRLFEAGVLGRVEWVLGRALMHPWNADGSDIWRAVRKEVVR